MTSVVVMVMQVLSQSSNKQRLANHGVGMNFMPTLFYACSMRSKIWLYGNECAIRRARPDVSHDRVTRNNVSSRGFDIIDRAHRLAEKGAVGQMMQLLECAARDGHADAAAMLGDMRLSGALVRRDLNLARDWYGCAAKLGMDEIEPIYIALLANGAGGTPRHWPDALARLGALANNNLLAARQQALIAQMQLTPDGDPLSLQRGEILSERPALNRCKNFLSPEECHYIVELCQGALQPATVVHPVTGALVRDPIRTARIASFPFVREDPVLHAINRRIAAATVTDYAQGEPLQVLCYAPGEEYKLHSDTLPAGLNQRDDTFLVALSEEYEGGETSFPKLRIDWRGGMGDALHFRNVDETGSPDPLTLHCGQPVLNGVKYMLSKWIRREPLDISGPPGRPF